MASSEITSILDSLHLEVEDTFKKIDEIWSKFGYEEDVIDRRRRTFVKHVVILLKEMLVEEENKLEGKKKTLARIETDIETLKQELGKSEQEILPNRSKMPLLSYELELLAAVKDLLQEKSVRTEKYNKINAEVIAIHKEFGEPPHKIQFQGIPSDVQVGELEKHLRNLHEEKKKRKLIFAKLSENLRNLYSISGKSPVSALEKVCCADSNKSIVPIGGLQILSLQCLEELEKLCNKCQKELDENHTKAEKLWQMIKQFWVRLEIDPGAQNKFSEDNKCSEATVDGKTVYVYSASVLDNLSKEVERLKELKGLNISKFVDKIRSELMELWRTKCFIEKSEFRFQTDNYMDANEFTETDFHSDVYTEELLNKFENEIEFWKSFTEHYSALIETVSKRNEMFSEYEQFDIRSEDVHKFANRGGALLQEEKKRKRMEKILPKLEEKLKFLNERYISENPLTRFGGIKNFLVYGQTIPFMIEDDWKQFHEKKELRKKAKKLAHSEAQVTLGTSQIQCPRKKPNTLSSSQIGLHTPPKKRLLAAYTTPEKQNGGATSSKPKLTANNDTRREILPNQPNPTQEGQSGSPEGLRFNSNSNSVKGKLRLIIKKRSAATRKRSGSQSSKTVQSMMKGSSKGLKLDEAFGEMVEIVSSSTIPHCSTHRLPNKMPTPGAYPACYSERKNMGNDQLSPEAAQETTQGQLSPASTYSAFKNSILGQSTLNSSMSLSRKIDKVREETQEHTATAAKSPMK